MISRKLDCRKTAIVLALFALLAFSLASAVLPAYAASGPVVDVQSFTLDNGMLFLVVERHTTPQVSCRVAVRAGSALEEAGKTGIAHMLEHMMFKGTKNYGTRDFEKDKQLQERIEKAYQGVLREQKKRKPDESKIRENLEEMARLRKEVQEIYVPQAFSSQLGRNGAVGVNAFTSKDQTQYFLSVPSDMIEQWFSIVSEQLFEPSFREFYVEKEVVQREWAYRYVNNPSGAGWLGLSSSMYAAHPYGNPTIGWKSDIDLFSTTDALDFHRKYYNPSNAVAVLVGDITVENARRFAGIYFGRYTAGERAPEEVTKEPAQKGPRRVVRYLEGARTPLVFIGHHGPSMGTRDFYALDVMNMVLSHGQGARMTRDIVRKGLAVSAWSYNPDNRYGGEFILGGTPNDPESLRTGDLGEEEKRKAYVKACEALEKTLLEQVERLAREPVSQKELDRIKKLSHYDFLTRLTSNESLAGTLATLEVQVGWEYLNTYLDEIASVTPEDILRVAAKYVREDNRTTCFVIPGGEPSEPAQPYEEIRSFSAAAARKPAAPGDLRNHSRYPTPEGWKHPLSFERSPEKIRYPEAETSNVLGAPLFYLPDRELPLINVNIFIKAGAVDVPDGMTGLGGLLNAAFVEGGTLSHGPSELAQIMDEHAIHLDASVSEEMSAVSLSVMREDWDAAVKVLREVLASPRFDEQVLESSRARLLTSLKRQAESAAVVSRRELEIRHFQGHPYGRDPLLALETVPGISREDLKAFVEKYFVPGNMVIAVSGDIDLREAEEGLQKVLLGLGADGAPERSLEAPSPTPPVLAFVHKPGQVQSHVSMALPGPLRTDPAYWKNSILVSILGGEDSLIYKRLREDLGLVYSTYFIQSYKWKAGWILGFIACKGDRTGQAIRETVGIMNTLRREIPAGELEQKRLDSLNSFVFNVDTPAALTGVYAQYRMRGEPLDTLEKIQDAFMEAGRDDLLRLADTYLDPEKLQIVVVGDGSIPVAGEGGKVLTMEEALQETAEDLGLPFEKLPLR